jgi:hypothetical protein
MTPSTAIPIAPQTQSSKKPHGWKPQSCPLTVVDASRASRDVAGEPLHSSLVFDASVRLQTGCAFCKAVTEDGVSVVSTSVARARYTIPSYSPAKIVTVWLYGVALEDILQSCVNKKTRISRDPGSKLREKGEYKRTSSSETLSEYSQYSMKTK